MNLCILEEGGEPAEAPYSAYDPPSAPECYFSRYVWERHFLIKTTGVRQVEELVRRGFDVFVNLCDGAWGTDSPGIEIVEALERLDVPFTGATSAFYEPTREQMKRVCHDWDIPTPRYVCAAQEGDVETAVAVLRFPLIVKHPNGYSSIGLTASSRVETPEVLREQARITMTAYGGALIEEFIEGREFTALVAENPDDPDRPIVYRPVEFRFPPGESFKHFHLKWVDYASMSCHPCDDPDLIDRLAAMSRRMFVGLNGASYGRCDIRMDRSGELYMLEINPNCGVFYAPQDAGSADFILLNDPAGHAGFVDTIVRAALARHQRRKNLPAKTRRHGVRVKKKAAVVE
jgi:D-alanine-D-alanine ligase